jgi:glycosyltransferase involved in cell wall biosynthesis
MMDDLFIGVTAWNSELFLQQCLLSIKRTTDGLRSRIGVADNQSKDRSVEIARDMGAVVHVENCSQSIALNRLLAMSRARHTLLIHSDVILIGSDWYPTCSRHLGGSVAFVSPEDIGCGPLTRPYGAGMPESCFMLFDTEKAKRARDLVWIRHRGIPWPSMRLDLEHYYVTHNLPEVIARRGYTWRAMKVHASPRDASDNYQPSFTPQYWSNDLASLRYGMGNFYSLDGRITHYHNWFDRVPKDIALESKETTEGNGKGMPLAFLSLGTRRFMQDLEKGQVCLPDPNEPQAIPKIIEPRLPDLSKPFAAI